MDRATTQRLWGAAVLIAIAVIFLPMLVKGPAPDSGVREVPLDMPKAPTQPEANVQELPLGEPGTLPDSGAVGFETATPEGTADVAPAAVAAGDYAINFGTYASASDAQKVIAALGSQQLAAYSDRVTANGKTGYRVRIGPYTTREAAESARIDAARVNPAVKAEVIALDAGAAAPAPAPVATSKPVETKPVVQTPVPTARTDTSAANDAAKAKPEEPKVAPTPTANTQTTTVAPKPATKPADKPVAATPKPADKPAASGTGYAVQLGAFSNAEEAAKLRDRARAAGFSATTETIRTDKGVLTRVKLGPVTSRQSADALRASAQSKLGVGGVVRSQP